MMIPNEVIIDLNAIRHNFDKIRCLARPKAGIMAVIKSDAYGHGMIPVAKALEPYHPDYFGVFELQEALELRNAGCKVPLLVMMGIADDEIPAAVDHDVTLALFQKNIAQRLSEKAQAKGRIVPVHIKVDTGMARLGVPWAEVADFVHGLLPLKGIRLAGIFSHLSVSDDPGNPFTDKQLERFVMAARACQKLGVCTQAVHIANSGGVLHDKGLDFTLVRPGISLYGSAPSPLLDRPISFEPAMRFKSRVIQVKTVPAGTPISYGGTYTTSTTATIATIPVGYDDGYSRLLSNKGQVLIHGKRVPVVGRVCMNLTMVDVSSLQGVSAGDEVVLLGLQGEERITAEEIADKTGTINYEVYCAIGKANRRTYTNGAEIIS